MKKRGHTEGIVTRSHLDGSRVYSAILIKKGQYFDRRFPTPEEAIAFRREDKLKDALWQLPSLPLKARAALETILQDDPLVAPVIDVFLRCSLGSGAPPLGTTKRKKRAMANPPGQPHSQRPMDPPPAANIRMNDYAQRWFEENTWRWNATGAAQLRSILLTHIMPAWRTRPVHTVTNAIKIQKWFMRLATTGLSRIHLKNIRAIFVMLLHAAQVDGLIQVNPCSHPTCSRKAIMALASRKKETVRCMPSNTTLRAS